MPIASFKQGIKLATEASPSVAPAAGAWWQGGRWHDVITDALPDISDKIGLIFPTGHSGRRSMNQQAPVVGRKWSEGEFTANVTADFIGALLHGALGGLSTNSIPSSTPSLVALEALNAASKSLVLTNPISNGGGILRFIISGTSLGGTIYGSGIDSYGNGASEQITFSSAGSFYFRTSFSSIAASGIQITSQNLNGSVTIDSFQGWEHIFSASDSNPTYSIEKIGDPTAGAASKSFMIPGLLLKELSLNTAAADNEGIFTISSSWEGDPTAASNSTAINNASILRIWPAWTLAINRDGANWFKVTNMNMTLNTGNRKYKAAAGKQNPQGELYLGRSLEASVDILVDNEVEYNRWRGASKQELTFTWDTDWKLHGSSDMKLTASLTDAYLVNVTGGDDDGAYQLSGDIRTIAGANDIAKFALLTGVPGTAYGSPL